MKICGWLVSHALTEHFVSIMDAVILGKALPQEQRVNNTEAVDLGTISQVEEKVTRSLVKGTGLGGEEFCNAGP